MTLSITSGTGTLSAPSVVLGADGTGTVTLTSPSAKAVTIAATTAGDGQLTDAEPTAATRPQPTVYAAPTTLRPTRPSRLHLPPRTPTTPVTPGTRPALPCRRARPW